MLLDLKKLKSRKKRRLELDQAQERLKNGITLLC
jgi:hypothetical protein